MKAYRQLLNVSLVLPASLLLASCSSAGGSQPSNPDDDPVIAAATQDEDAPNGPHVNAVTEAPAGFDGLSNGNCSQAEFKATGLTFSEVEAFEDGIAPTFNNVSCMSCHE